ncbi:UDP-2,3-diacetamido-2,3-dideoxy-D-glucuronate 2-epimerase [Magnetospirillum sp. LM-5]|uniref:non-hydrolyzing UDP-N-acetylglucosamine 2-epimerase n=1 Tax=Magnetospirillum sp. LM-5 TaxID=2681466 RepID=UPI00138111FB|nr:UDP-N-acetylglucosamine 2-epimerase (non-hydrolyzing) [Magnetospirillum sp. LM-5]CAA7618760.1 UDP-2,3-diacetamido-2,3-dideoxy-D-glucuronate 2-epimerase [Magnetospirillum sp. LM-5]
MVGISAFVPGPKPLQIVTILGTRPQLVKAKAVSAVIAATPGVEERIIHTGQHFDPQMSDTFIDELGLPQPVANLGIHGGGHGAMTGRMMVALEPILADSRADVALVYGDTNSALAGALVAAKLGLPLVHVEAGLRSFNRAMPEEVNRVLIDHLSTLLFCPTLRSVANLADEGIVDGVIHVGDVMYDVALAMSSRAQAESTILARLALEPGHYAVATLHRAEGTSSAEKLSQALDFLRDRARVMPVVLPLHPRTRQTCELFGLGLDDLTVCEPLGYLDMTRLVSSSALVMTDSGGLQKEAYFHRVPCVTLRDETEWPETIECGWNRLWKAPDYQTRRDIDDFGDGRAANRIIQAILDRFTTSDHG